MRIIRYHDERGATGWAREHPTGRYTRLEGGLEEGFTDSGSPLTAAKVLAPVAPSAILCIGLNYHQHAHETGMEVPAHPVLFMKNPAAVTHPGDPIRIPAVCQDPPQVDYEAELAVVIGRPARDVSLSRALSHVAGYTAANDVSARRWQKHGGGGQWVRGKSFDTFCPLGPVLVTPDEVPDPQALTVRCVLNGDTVQESGTADMIFPVAALISFLSQGTTLLAGTVILTGTPSGVGFARNPPLYLTPGDRVEVTIEGIGTLVNPVEAEDPAGR